MENLGAFKAIKRKYRNRVYQIRQNPIDNPEGRAFGETQGYAHRKNLRTELTPKNDKNGKPDFEKFPPYLGQNGKTRYHKN